MKAKKNLLLTITLVILILTSVSLYIFPNGARPAIDRNIFRIPETEKIDAVTLQSSNGSIELKYENRRWRVNDQWDADMQMIKVLFATLRQVEPRRPVSAMLLDSAMRQIAKRGTSMVLLEGGEKKMAFQVCGNESKTETWFLKEGESQPYVVTIPGYHVYVGGIFELDRAGWRDKRIFEFNWRNFRSLKVNYPGNALDGFEIELQGKYFGLKNMDVSDTTKVNDYLDAVSLLFAEHFVTTETPGSHKVMANFQITDSAGKIYTLDLLEGTKKSDVIYGRVTSGELVAFRIGDVGDILRKRDYFLFKPR